MIVGDVNRYIVDAQREKQRKTDRWNMESRCTRETPKRNRACNGIHNVTFCASYASTGL